MTTTDNSRADALTEAVTHTIDTIGRQLDLIAERAPGNFLDKVPVVRSLTAHKKRLEKALAAVEQHEAAPAATCACGYSMETSCNVLDPTCCRNTSQPVPPAPLEGTGNGAELPPLPDPVRTFADHSDRAYSKQQMVDYAKAAMSRAPRTEVAGAVPESTTTEMRAPNPFYVEARECDRCGHIGINDGHETNAACHSCEWNGPSPIEDKCPGCGDTNCMGIACPKCSGLYSLLAEKSFIADEVATTPSADAAAAPADERAAFEAECLRRGYERRDLTRLQDGYYVTAITYMWDGWQARAAASQPAAAAGQAIAGGIVGAWVTDDDRSITAAQKQRALADGGATASSVQPYSIPCYLNAPPAQEKAND